jgi:single-strand DNA-binding protein
MYQRLVLVGHLGRDPEMKYSANGVPVTNFPVATHHKWADAAGEPQEETTWFRIAVFGKQAEVCSQYLSKGQKVLIEGSLVADANGSPRVFERKDGSAGAAFEVRASVVRFLSSKSESAKPHDEAASDAAALFD